MVTFLIGLAAILTGLCGPSKQEKDQAIASAGFTQTLRQHYAQLYSQQQGTLDKLNDAISAPSTLGFSPAERATYNTQALEGTAGNYANARRSVANFSAGQGGGSSTGIQSGVNQQLQAQAANEAAKTLSDEELGITQADYNQGRIEKQKNIAGLQALAGAYDPNNASGQSLQAGEQAFSQAKSNREASQAGWKALAGLGTSLATSFIPGAGLAMGLAKGAAGAASNDSGGWMPGQ